MKIFALIVLGALVSPQTAQAYLDPGTTSSVFTVFSSILPGLVVFFGVLIGPLKRIFKWLKDKLSRNKPKQKTE